MEVKKEMAKATSGGQTGEISMPAVGKNKIGVPFPSRESHSAFAGEALFDLFLFCLLLQATLNYKGKFAKEEWMNTVLPVTAGRSLTAKDYSPFRNPLAGWSAAAAVVGREALSHNPFSG
jgi:hypothetical protein